MLILNVMRMKLRVVIEIITLHTLKNMKHIFFADLLIVICVDNRFSKPVVL